MKRRFTVWTIALLVAGCVCALPWTPLWNVVLDVGYVPLCLLGVDRWFSAGETLVLSDGTAADPAAVPQGHARATLRGRAVPAASGRGSS